MAGRVAGWAGTRPEEFCVWLRAEAIPPERQERVLIRIPARRGIDG